METLLSLSRRSRLGSIVALLSMSSMSCNALVGLDHVAYDDGPAQAGGALISGGAAATGGQNGDDFGTGGVGTGGSSCGSCEGPSVQAKWPKSSVFFSVAPGAQSTHFYRFDQDTHVLDAFEFGSDAPVSSTQLDQSFPLWAAVPSGSADELLGYEPESGVAIDLIVGGGSDGARTYGYGTSGRTLLRSMVIQGAPSFLGYTGPTGALRTVPGSSSPPGRAALEKLIGPGWTSLEPIQIDGEMRLLAHSRERGELQLFRVAEDEVTPGPVSQSPVTATLMRTFHVGTQHHILFYDALVGGIDIADASLTSSGELRMSLIAGSTDGLGGAGFQGANPWREGLTDIIVCGLASAPYALAWNANTGILSVQDLTDLDTVGVPSGIK